MPFRLKDDVNDPDENAADLGGLCKRPFGLFSADKVNPAPTRVNNSNLSLGSAC